MKRPAALFVAAVVMALVVTPLLSVPASASPYEFCLDGIDRVPAADQAALSSAAADPSPACGAPGGVCAEGPGPGRSGQTPAATAGPNK